MPMPSSGKITTQTFRDFFEITASTPINSSDWYRGGPYVRATYQSQNQGTKSINNQVPTSGRIALSDLYGVYKVVDANNLVPGNPGNADTHFNTNPNDTNPNPSNPANPADTNVADGPGGPPTFGDSSDVASPADPPGSGDPNPGNPGNPGNPDAPALLAGNPVDPSPLNPVPTDFTDLSPNPPYWADHERLV